MNWAERAKAIVERSCRAYGDDRDEAMDEGLALVNERLDAEGLRTKVWGNMTYACKRCGHRELYELEVGVEGPPAWREDMTYIACAFGAGHCSTCGGEMLHTHFRGDVTYAEPREQSVANVFRVPREWPTYPTRGIYEDGNVIVARSDSAFLSLNLAAVRS